MKLFNWSRNGRNPNQKELGKITGLKGVAFGFGLQIEDFDLYGQIKDYRTDMLNGTNWRPTSAENSYSLSYIQFLNLLSEYSTAIFNDFCKVGFVVFARIDERIFYISQQNYSKSGDKITIRSFPNATVFVFNEPNSFCGEKTIWEKCKPFQQLYNVALSCQQSGMTNSGFVTMLSPVTPAGANTIQKLDETAIFQLEERLSKTHGLLKNQNNMMILNQQMDVKTIAYDFGKLGILETKQLCEEFVCSKMGVPYVLLPSSGQTFANYEQANKMLYENHSKWCELFCKFVKREFGLDIDYSTIAEAGKGIV